MLTTTLLPAHTDSGPRTGAPTLLYLPGWCGGREVFAALLSRTARTRRSVSLDWRGHGDADPCTTDFDTDDLIDDTIALIDRLHLDTVVPVALSHAGWVAVELRRRLGAERVPAIALIDWMPTGAPGGFLDALDGLQSADSWRNVRERLFAMWTAGVDDVAVQAYVESMGDHGFDMWSRAGREISQAFRSHPVPLDVLAELETACPTVHIYAQPRDDAYLEAQQRYAAEHPWYSVRRMYSTSHFPCLESPAQVETAIDEFLTTVGQS